MRETVAPVAICGGSKDPTSSLRSYEFGMVQRVSIISWTMELFVIGSICGTSTFFPLSRRLKERLLGQEGDREDGFLRRVAQFNLKYRGEWVSRLGQPNLLAEGQCCIRDMGFEGPKARLARVGFSRLVVLMS